MRVFYFTLVLFAAVVTVTIFHISTVTSFQREGIVVLQNLDNAVRAEEFTTASNVLNNFETLYRSRRRWFSIILDTADLDKIEVHIARMRKFLELEAITEFYSEFVELYETVNTLPYREGVHFEVLF